MGQGASLVVSSEKLEQDEDLEQGQDYTLSIPDECLACIFHNLKPLDRKPCSLVCKRWHLVEGQSRIRLSLDARAEIGPAIPGLFKRFEYVSKLALRCDRRMVSIDDEGLVLVGIHCRNLRNLKLRSCKDITDAGVSKFAQVCDSLKKLSCGSCSFGTRGINSVIMHCKSLEELSVKRPRSLVDIPIGTGGGKLKRICLKELYSAHYFAPLIAGSKNLRTLKLCKCAGDWDNMLEFITIHVKSLVEVHLERIHVGDMGLSAVSRSTSLEVLHLVKTPECTNAGLVAIAHGCRNLRKLHIDGWRTNSIGDEGLIAIGRKCLNLKELVLIGLNPTIMSLTVLASNCHFLERLALCGSETIGDPELSCIAAKCYSLKKLCIKGCPVSDQGMEALVNGCPKLVKVKVKKCRGVTSEGADWLMANKGFLAVSFDEVSPKIRVDISSEASSSEQGPSAIASTSKSTLAKAKLSLLAGGNFVACTFSRLLHGS